jgi:hypothetical protein
MDLKTVYAKLTALQRLANYNSTAGNAYTLNAVPVVIGDLYKFEGYIESLSFDWDSEMPWEIEDGLQAPLYCNVAIDFKYLTPTPGFALR